jgi:hypothetical protein
MVKSHRSSSATVPADDLHTPKGSAVLADAASMTHYLLDFLAQIMSILPAQEDVIYNVPFG